MSFWRVLLLCLPCVSFAAQTDPEAATGLQKKSVVHAKHMLVVSANPYATDAGYQMLAKGGTAVDAAIATQLVLGLVEPQSSGIGGGLFLLHYDQQTKQLRSIDGRETAPKAASADWFRENGQLLPWNQAFVGGKAVGTPGVIRALALAHQQHGKLPWPELFQPAIRLATAGFVVSPRLNALLAQSTHPAFSQFPATQAYFFPAGQPLAVGFTRKNPDYAALLTRIANEGPAAFYQGQNAQAIVDAVNNAPLHAGQMTLDDIASYQAVEREVICRPYRQLKVCGMAPPSSGSLAVLQILGILEHFELKPLKPMSAQFIHLFSQASRLAFVDRDRYIADPAFSPVPVAGLLANDYLAARAKLIDPQLDTQTFVAGAPQGAQPLADAPALEYANTSHLSVVDSKGNAVSLTTSIENAFGSGLFINGYLLNNQLTDFSLDARKDGKWVANRVEAGKRPRSSMAPMMVFNAAGEPVIIAGSPGGSRIIDYVALALIGMLDFNLSAQQAAELPHVTHRNDVLAIEEGSPLTSLVGEMKERGYKVQVTDLNSGLHLIQKTATGWQSGVDPRREGSAKGQ